MYIISITYITTTITTTSKVRQEAKEPNHKLTVKEIRDRENRRIIPSQTVILNYQSIIIVTQHQHSNNSPKQTADSSPINIFIKAVKEKEEHYAVHSSCKDIAVVVVVVDDDLLPNSIIDCSGGSVYTVMWCYYENYKYYYHNVIQKYHADEDWVPKNVIIIIIIRRRRRRRRSN